MTTDMSFLSLVLEASPIVQLVMLSLLLASVASWAVIFRKRGALNNARRRADRFEKEFCSGTDLTELYRRISAREESASGM
jgi:biopolymer transport protein TolQ